LATPRLQLPDVETMPAEEVLRWAHAEFGDRRWLPAIVLAVAVLVAAEIINPPPAAGGQDPGTGAWIAFAGHWPLTSADATAMTVEIEAGKRSRSSPGGGAAATTMMPAASAPAISRASRGSSGPARLRLITSTRFVTA